MVSRNEVPRAQLTETARAPARTRFLLRAPSRRLARRSSQRPGRLDRMGGQSEADSDWVDGDAAGVDGRQVSEPAAESLMCGCGSAYEAVCKAGGIATYAHFLRGVGQEVGRADGEYLHTGHGTRSAGPGRGARCARAEPPGQTKAASSRAAGAVPLT